MTSEEHELADTVRWAQEVATVLHCMRESEEAGEVLTLDEKADQSRLRSMLRTKLSEIADELAEYRGPVQ